MWRRRLIVLGLVVVTLVVAYQVNPQLSLESMQGHEQYWQDWRDAHPYQAFGLMLVVVTLVSFLPLLSGKSMVSGWLLGFWSGLAVVSLGSIIAALITFLVSRYLLREVIEARTRQRFVRVHRNLDREGPFYLFALRLVPALPFMVVNGLLGLTRMRLFTFWWVSQLGMLPGHLVWVWFGASLPDLEEVVARGPAAVMTPQLLASLMLLATFPFVVRLGLRRVRRRRPLEPEAEAGEQAESASLSKVASS